MMYVLLGIFSLQGKVLMAKPYHMKGLGKGLDAHLPVPMATTLHAMCVDTRLNYAMQK